MVKWHAWILGFALLGPAMGQQVVLPHLTRGEGGFTTHLILENPSDAIATFQILPYFEDGASGATVAGTVEPQATITISPADLFGADLSYSHLVWESDHIRLSAAYTAAHGNGSPAHVATTTTRAARYRLYSSDWSQTFDGLAVVNLGQQPTNLRVLQRGADGRVIDERILINDLPAMGKGRALLGGPGIAGFTADANTAFDLLADQPLAVTALRGTLPSADFLWPVAVRPFTPGMAKVTDDMPWAVDCVPATSLGANAADANNQPQGEVMIAVAGNGTLVATAKDFRYGPTNSTLYNDRVWNGLYRSDDGGASWRYGDMHDAYPDAPLQTETSAILDLPVGTPLSFNHMSDPVVAFDRDGNLYTTALAYRPRAGVGTIAYPSAITGARRNADGSLEQLHYFAAEDSPLHFNDKNWIAVDPTQPRETTTVVIAWKLFAFTQFGNNFNDISNGYIALSADGAETFASPIALPIPARLRAGLQFLQPVIGPDPTANNRRTLYVFFRAFNPQSNLIHMALLKAPLEQIGDTQAQAAALQDPSNWTVVQNIFTGLESAAANGYGHSFRFNSYYMPVIDPDTGHLYVCTAVAAPNSGAARVKIAKSSDGGLSWSPLRDVSPSDQGDQVLPTLAVAGGTLSVVWYDSRHESIHDGDRTYAMIDVYYAELTTDLTVQRELRLTQQSQVANHPVFTRPRNKAKAGDVALAKHQANLPHVWPHDLPPTYKALPPKSDHCDPYGFLGDYIGIAADADHAYLAWTDMRDLAVEETICTLGEACDAVRNQNIYFARIRKQKP